MNPEMIMDFQLSTYYDIPAITVNTPNATVENVGQLKNFLDKSFLTDKNKMIIDLSCVKYIDSTFLGLIVQYLKKYKQTGGDLKLVSCEGCGDHPIWVMLETTGAGKIFSIFDSIDEALRSFKEN